MPVRVVVNIVGDDVKAELDISSGATLLEVLQAIGILEKVKQELLEHIELEEKEEEEGQAKPLYYPLN